MTLNMPISIAAAENAADTTAAWFTLAGALGGVLLTSAVALTTAVLNHRWQTQAADDQGRKERDQQLRQNRREAYARYWSAWNRYIHQLRELQRTALEQQGSGALIPTELIEQTKEAELGWRDGADALFLICGRDVSNAAEAHMEATEARHHGAEQGEWLSGRGTYRRLNDAMREELLELP
ncbi:hypothetical protein ABZ490_48835 [Streptomyces sp. NPDC005811]|uniref:hypothetical protein n=1 Tax=Streptomyces sp. NPDC005811 TaxID=3154565 RepID=UPI0033D5A0E5